MHVMHYMFYVPNRLAWDGWEDFITEGTGTIPTWDPADPNGANWTLVNSDDTQNALFHRGYNLIWNEYFRDEDDAEVAIDDYVNEPRNAYELREMYNELRNEPEQGTDSSFDGSVTGSTATIQAADARDALRLLRLKERRSMFGDRYFDILRSYGVKTNYNMLERPESLGRSRHVVSFTDIPATSTTSGGSTVGDLAGHGIVGLHHRLPRKAFSEHGYIYGLAVVRPQQITYTSSPYDTFKTQMSDYWAPEYDGQSPQEIQFRHVRNTYLTSTVGYVPKFQEYRKAHSFMANNFDDKQWTFGQAIPGTNVDDARNGLRQVDPTDYDQAFNSTSADEPHYRALVHNSITAYRLVANQSR